MAVMRQQGDKSMLYQAYQAQRDMAAPARAVARLATWSLSEMPDA